MARHVVKITFMLLSGLIIASLLSFMLISDQWIKINTEKLNDLEKKLEADYQLFTGPTVEQVKQTTTQPNLISANVKLNRLTKTTTTITTTVKTTTQTTTAESEHDNLTDQDGEEQEDTDQNADDSENLDYEQESDAKRHKRSDEQVVDYVYLTKLWPFVKYKSLYSECIEYKKVNLKISSAFLTQPNKEPLLGTVSYGKLINQLTNNSQLQCEKPGMIKCLVSQQCVQGKLCDGITDCSDQSDEQFCDSATKCHQQPGGIPIQCNNRCWQYWNKCDRIPHCLDLSDELSTECTNSQRTYTFIENVQSMFNPNISIALKATNLAPFTFGQYHFDKSKNCFVTYFDFKSAQLIRKENLRYLTQPLADHIQDKNNISYHLQLAYSLAFVSALVFTLLALLSLAGVSCFKKMCYQCPFWFYGFFAILAWLSCLFGLMAFIFQCISAKYKTVDPLSRLPIDNELIRLNPELIGIQEFGITFWIAVGVTSFSFLASFISCIVCCNLPTLRHEDKEYQIMQLPTYS